METIDQIVARKRRETHRLDQLSVANVKPSIRDLAQFVGTGRMGLSVIADLQRLDRFGRSPNHEDLDLVETAIRLDDAEVDAVGIGTDRRLWGADLEDLSAISESCETLPVMRRDLILTAEDVYASRLAGADAIVLMPTVIDDVTLHELTHRAATVHMSAVAQCWDGQCVQKALDNDVRMIELMAWGPDGEDRDLSRIERLAKMIPPHVSVIASGGLTLDEALRLRGVVDAVCLDEALMSARDPAAAIRRLKED